MDCRPIEDAYRKHYAGVEITDLDWTPAQDAFRAISVIAVQRAASKHNIARRTWEELISNVECELVEKFVSLGFGAPDSINNFQAFLRTTAFRATITVLRKIKSPLAGRLESDQLLRPAPESSLPDDDLFLRIRQSMGPFRFPEFALARDVLLSLRLATGGYPGHEFLKFVPAPSRLACYVAAVFDINSSIMGLVNVRDPRRVA